MMNSLKSLPEELRKEIAQFVATRQIIYGLLFLLFVMAIYFLSHELVLRSGSGLSSAILSVSMAVLQLLIFASLTLKERSTRRKEIFKLLKSRHSSFFDWVRSDVTNLIEKGRTDEGRLPGSP